MTNETTLSYGRKSDARRVARRLRDHGILSRARFARGDNALCVLVPPKFTVGSIHLLALKLYREG